MRVCADDCRLVAVNRIVLPQVRNAGWRISCRFAGAAHRMGVERDDSHMQDVHLADAMREIVRKTRKSLSDTARGMIPIEQSFHKIAGC